MIVVIMFPSTFLIQAPVERVLERILAHLWRSILFGFRSFVLARDRVDSVSFVRLSSVAKERQRWRGDVASCKIILFYFILHTQMWNIALVNQHKTWGRLDRIDWVNAVSSGHRMWLLRRVQIYLLITVLLLNFLMSTYRSEFHKRWQHAKFRIRNFVHTGVDPREQGTYPHGLDGTIHASI